MKITTRKTPVEEAKAELMDQWVAEMEGLIDHIDGFLEERIAVEFGEFGESVIVEFEKLEQKLELAGHVIDTLSEENIVLAATCEKLQRMLEHLSEALD
jgi:hypothetical protein